MASETEPCLPLDLFEQPDAVYGQKVGYARVSSKDQNLARQKELLRKEGVYALYEDRMTGSTRKRPKLEEALRYVRSGDQLIVVSMDRLARSVADLHAIVDELTTRGVSVRFLKEGQIYSLHSTPIAKLMLGLLGTVAEFERAIIRERQAEGIARAKERGVYSARPGVLSEDEVVRVRELVELGVPKAEVARRFKVSRATVLRAMKDNYRPRRTGDEKK
ncbi:recombinase family protein [Corynebacterium sp. 22_2729]